MFDKESVYFQYSRRGIQIAGALFILIGVIWIVFGLYVFVGASDKDLDFAIKLAILIVCSLFGILDIVFGALGLYSGFTMKCVLCFAITASIVVVSCIYNIFKGYEGYWVPTAIAWISLLASIPTVICAWIVYFGLRSGSGPLLENPRPENSH